MIGKTLVVNGIETWVISDSEMTLADVIRGQLKLTGTKVGCGEGQCGACNVIMDGKLIRSCVTKMKKVPNLAAITTIEGIGTPGNLHPLQVAWMVRGGAQCGFCSPGFIVSSKALLDGNPDPTREDIRNWFQKYRNACRCTGYKVLVDAVMDAAKVLRGEMTNEELEFKLPEDGRIWGTGFPRPSAKAKVTGTCDYGADLGIKMPDGTLHLALAQAKVSHANIISIDTSEAKKMPGVTAVLTHKDVKGKNRINTLVAFPTNKGDGWDRPLLCDEKIFQYGDAYAIVCADTECNARKAANKVKIELEELPAYMSAPEAMAEDAIEIHPGTPNIYNTQKMYKGEETGPIFENAAHVVEDDFYVGRQPHMPIEPDVGFAYMNDDSKLVIHSKSIAIHVHAMMITDGIGFPYDDIIVVQNNSGGTFGYKMSATMEALLGIACLATGKPVCLRYDYYQQMTYTGKRSPVFSNVRLAADADGMLQGMEMDWSVDHGPYSEFADLLTLKVGKMFGAGYDIPNIRGNGRTVCTNHTWGSAFRSFGSPQSEFASEVLMDQLAEKIGMDPLELRYKNVYREGSTMTFGQLPDVYPLAEMIDKLKPKYKEALERAQKESTDEKKRGVGVSIGMYSCGTGQMDFSEAWVELMPDNTITIYAAWEDHGQGADMGALGTSHEALRPMNVSPERINLVLNDSSRVPMSGPSAGSRQQVVTGNAIRVGCELLVAAMKKEDGTYRTYDEMVTDGIEVKQIGTWATTGAECDENGQGANVYPAFMYGLFMAEVEVETSSGKTEVKKMTMVLDVGKINNKLVVDGQVYGGLSQGIGLALSEDFEDIKKHSTLVGAGFPYIKQIPDDLEVIYVETPRDSDQGGPFGSAGCGELTLTCPHGSIINAIYNACGVRITKLPALPEKVLAGL